MLDYTHLGENQERTESPRRRFIGIVYSLYVLDAESTIVRKLNRSVVRASEAWLYSEYMKNISKDINKNITKVSGEFYQVPVLRPSGALGRLNQ